MAFKSWPILFQGAGKGMQSMEQFDLPEYYEPRFSLGYGAYGRVISAEDKRSGKLVAIKKILNFFSFEYPQVAKRVLREIKLLSFFRGHENICALDSILPIQSYNYDSICISLDAMDANLSSIIESKQPLSDLHYQVFMYRILKGLKCMHHSNVLHRDLKPSNILINAQCDIKIADFGLARVQNPDAGSNDMTVDVVTIFYKAPELLLESTTYAASVDIWSIGCILAELLCSRVFIKGKTYADQLEKILEIVGCPSEAEINALTSEKSKRYLHRMRVEKAYVRKDLRPLLPEGTSPAAIDLLNRIFVFDPAQRITLQGCLEHPYFADVRNPEEEFVIDAKLDVSFEDAPLDIAVLRRMIYEEVRRWNSSMAPPPPPADAVAVLSAPAGPSDVICAADDEDLIGLSPSVENIFISPSSMTM